MSEYPFLLVESVESRCLMVTSNPHMFDCHVPFLNDLRDPRLGGRMPFFLGSELPDANAQVVPLSMCCNMHVISKPARDLVPHSASLSHKPFSSSKVPQRPSLQKFTLLIPNLGL